MIFSLVRRLDESDFQLTAASNDAQFRYWHKLEKEDQVKKKTTVASTYATYTDPSTNQTYLSVEPYDFNLSSKVLAHASTDSSKDQGFF